MAENENVTIRIRVRADTSQIDRVQKKLAALCAQAEACEKKFARLGKNIDDAGRRMKDLEERADSTGKRMRDLGGEIETTGENTKKNRKETDKLQKVMQTLNRVGSGLAKFLKGTLKFALKAVLIETLAYAAALSSVNLLLKTGDLLSRGWTSTVRGLGVAAANAAAGVATLAATFAAAMRQMQAAQSSGGYGGNFVAASRALRSVQGDASLAAFGLQAVTGAFAAASKNAKVTGQTVAGLRGLTDFAVVSGDMEKGLAAAANVISLLQKGEAAGGETMLSAAKDLGPEFAKAYKDVLAQGAITNDELIKLISSGKLAQEAGIEGTAANVQGTLIGQLKSFATEMQVIFGDIGQNFIGPVQTAFNEVRRILKRTVFQITGNLNKFANGPFIDGVVGAADKIGNLTAKLFNEYLPKTQEVFGNFIDGWRRFTDFFSRTTARFSGFLNKFSEGSSIMNQFFGEILRAVGGGLYEGFENFNDLIMRNKDEFLDFGKAIGKLISEIFRLFREIRTAFFNALPAINSVLNAITMLLGALVDVVQVVGGLGAAGGLAVLAGGVGVKAMGARALAGKGGAVGAVGAAGYFGANLAGGYMARNYDSAGYAIGGGALAGGAAGAAIGTMIAPGMGTAVGAVVGAIAGGIIGFFKNEQFKQQVRQEGSAFATEYANAINENFIQNGYFEEAEERMGDFSNFVNEISGGIAKGGIFAKETIDQYMDEYEKLSDSIDLGRRRTADLARITGKTEREIQDLARAFELDLSDPLVSLQDVLRETGLAVGKFGDDFNAQLNVAFGEAASYITGPLAILENEPAIEAVLQATGEALRTGTFTDLIGLQFLEAAAQQANLVGMGDPIKAFEELLINLGPGGAQFGAGTILEGQRAALMSGQTGTAFNQYIAAQRSAIIDQLMQNITSETAMMGIGINTELVRAQLTQMSDAELARAADVGRTTGFLSGTFMQMAQGGMQGPADLIGDVEQGLERLGVTGDLGTEYLKSAAEQNEDFLRDFGTAIDVKVTDPFQTAVANFDQAVDDMITGLKEVLNFEEPSGLSPNTTNFRTHARRDSTITNQQVDPFGPGGPMDIHRGRVVERTGTGFDYDALPPNSRLNPPERVGDTKTSRLSALSGAHGRLSRGIPGRRSITSMMRNYNLGSLSSDHASGRAYDLVGDNLGMYQKAVLGEGGYADFHGRGGNRHLHVVPNGVGDTATPYMGAGSMDLGMAGGGASNINVQVYAAPGMNEEALANAVIRKINAAQRNMAERR